MMRFESKREREREEKGTIKSSKAKGQSDE
jgi:hypothetical protein